MVTLKDLAREFGGELHGISAEQALRDVQMVSRTVGQGDLFAALPGSSADGSRFVAQALERGALAVLSPAPLELPSNVANWIHPQARAIAGAAAARVHGQPGREMFVIAVTGTNGKTTTAHLAGQLLAACGRRPAVLGTAGNRLADGVLLKATHTTPDAPGLQRLLARHRALGGDCVALEASSHALDQDRLAGLEVGAAVFTNLTRDHLDYHGDMERYAAAKARLFASLSRGAAAIVNADDPASERMAAVARERGATVHTFSARSRADLFASRLEVDSRGTRFFLEGMGIQRTGVFLPLVGRFNVENALAALAAVLVSGASPSHALGGLALASSAPGRLERVDTQSCGFGVLVDYAHTEDALRKVLSTVREGLEAEGRRRGDHGGRLLCVFGCGGDRDRGKRPLMGKAAGELADLVFLTSDNPRSEDPRAIADDVLAGLEGTSAQVTVELDRRSAILEALRAARPHDVVLLAGKGHETTQQVGTSIHAFDDRAVAAELLASGAWRRQQG